MAKPSSSRASKAGRKMKGWLNPLILKTKVGSESRGGKIGPTRWASPIHPELGPGWAIKL